MGLALYFRDQSIGFMYFKHKNEISQRENQICV